MLSLINGLKRIRVLSANTFEIVLTCWIPEQWKNSIEYAVSKFGGHRTHTIVSLDQKAL